MSTELTPELETIIKRDIPFTLDQWDSIVFLMKDICEIAGEAAIEAYKKSMQFQFDAEAWSREEGWKEPR